MTIRRLVRLIPSVALAVLIFVPSGTRLQPAVPSRPARASPSPFSASVPSNRPDGERVREIARQSLIGPAGSEPDTLVEPYVAVDPKRPDVVVAVFQEGRFPDGGAAAIGFASSLDGGRTWTSGVLPGLTRVFGGAYRRASDPSVAFGPDGSAYASSILIRGPDREGGIAVNRSDDGGRTWNAPVFIERYPARPGDDFPRIAVDHGSSSTYAGRVYVTYVHGDRVAVRWSDDRAATWSASRFVSPGRGFVPSVILGPDGGLTVVYISPRPRQQRPRLVSRTSHDGGTSFGPPIEVGVMRSRISRGFRATGVEEAAADPVTGTLFVVWEDATRREDGLNDVVLARSVDRGTTWTRPAKVNPDTSGSGTDHLQPAVAALDDRVHVVYFTRAISEGRPSQLVQLRSITSTDRGVSFEQERTIGPPADLRFAAVVRPDRTRFLGDYVGVAVSAKSLVIVWCRSFAPAGVGGHHVTMWAATIPEAA
ncbi:MAG TPA: sialidase family protein [Actinomycetota bacterium]